jgi:hypothetical protein
MLRKRRLNAEKAKDGKPDSSPDDECSAFRPAQAEARNDRAFIILSAAKNPSPCLSKE